MEDRKWIGLLHQFGIQIQKEIKATIGFGVVNITRHEDVSGVVIPF